MKNNKIKEHVYYVSGMHCASCEVLIEKKLLESAGVKSVEASTEKEEVLIEYENEAPAPGKLNEIFKREGYKFNDSPTKKSSSLQKETPGIKLKEALIILGIGIFIIAGFIGLNKMGLSGLVNVTSTSSLPMFFAFGLIAGISSCAALVGGIILSMSKQWNQLYVHTDSTWEKIQPHLIFNAGRLISYGFFGAILGAIGSQLDFSLKFGPILILTVSIIMIFLAFQMFGFKLLGKLRFTLPKFITRFVADESHFKGRYMPFLMGAATFLLPCGFTITVQGLALISGQALQGGLIMFLFALGTTPMLLGIGLSSVKLSQKAHLSERFMKVAGILVLFFALYNINAQLNVLGVSSLSDLNNDNVAPKQSSKVVTPNTTKPPVAKEILPPVVNGKQVLKMDATSSKYSPNYLKVKVGVPVRWEITDKGTSGCTNAIVANGLFEGEIPLTPGKISTKEFTPTKVGKYKFTCWMGMVSGTIEVVN